MTYEPAADVRLHGQDILNWLVYEIDRGRDPEHQLEALAKGIAGVSSELVEAEAAGETEVITAKGKLRDDLLRDAIERRRQTAPADNPWQGPPRAG